MGWNVYIPMGLLEDGRNYLTEHGHQLITGTGFTPEALKNDFITYQPEAVVVRDFKITRELVELNPNLKVVVRHGAGFDSLDLKALADHNVAALYCPVANSTSVAETAMMLILECSKNINGFRKILKTDYLKAKFDVPKYTINGKTLGIIGCGNVGSRLAVRALAMEMNVLAYDPFKPAADFPEGVEVVRDLDRIFTESDYVSIHTPNTPLTNNMVTMERLKMMKPTAYLINTSRGVMVDENDLYVACRDGIIAGAGLDVLRQEPVDPENSLFTLDNVLINSHIGGSTVEAAKRASYFSAMGIQEIYEGKQPTWPIPMIDYETAPTYTDTRESGRAKSGLFDF